MPTGVLVDPVLLFVAHAMAAGNLAGGTRLVARTGKRPVTESLRPVLMPFRIPLVDDHFHWHRTAPQTATAFRIVGRYRETAMPSLAIYVQRRSRSMPGCLDFGWFIATADQVQFADLINVGYFQSRGSHPNAQSFYLVPNPELVGSVSSRTNRDSK